MQWVIIIRTIVLCKNIRNQVIYSVLVSYSTISNDFFFALGVYFGILRLRIEMTRSCRSDSQKLIISIRPEHAETQEKWLTYLRKYDIPAHKMSVLADL